MDSALVLDTSGELGFAMGAREKGELLAVGRAETGEGIYVHSSAFLGEAVEGGELIS